MFGYYNIYLSIYPDNAFLHSSAVGSDWSSDGDSSGTGNSGTDPVQSSFGESDMDSVVSSDVSVDWSGGGSSADEVEVSVTDDVLDPSETLSEQSVDYSEQLSQLNMSVDFMCGWIVLLTFFTIFVWCERKISHAVKGLTGGRYND